MSPSADPSPPRRPIFFPVVIATVFLTIIAMIVGYVLGERHRDRLRTREASQTQTDPELTPSQVTPSQVQAVKLCPQATQDTAAELGFPNPLTQILMIETDNESTVWICQDPAGKLYYQGKTGGLEADLVERKNGLFLSDVVAAGGKEFQATAPDGARFVVTQERLEVHFANGKTQVNKVTQSE